MKTIHKQKIKHGYNSIVVPIGSIILSVQNQNGFMTVWYECWTTTSDITEIREIYVYGTGDEIHESNVRYIGTVQQDEYVWHIYEQLKQ